VQIARIASTTLCCPAGMFNVDDESGIEKAEDYEAPRPQEMGAVGAWVHR